MTLKELAQEFPAAAFCALMARHPSPDPANGLRQAAMVAMLREEGPSAIKGILDAAAAAVRELPDATVRELPDATSGWAAARDAILADHRQPSDTADR